MSHLNRLALAVLFAAAPASAFAAAPDPMDQCVQAFLNSDAAKDRKVTVRKRSQLSRDAMRRGSYRIEVVARTRDSGEQLARFTCHVDSKHRIVAVDGTPPATVASIAAAE